MLLCMTIMIINFIKYILFSFNVLILSRIHYILLRPKIGMVNSAFFFQNQSTDSTSWHVQYIRVRLKRQYIRVRLKRK